MLVVFLPRSQEMEGILKPASSALILIIITNILSIESGNFLLRAGSGTVFAATSVWLISRGEVRSELRTIAKRDSIVSLVREDSISRSGSLSSYNPKVAEMEDLRRKRRELSETDDSLSCNSPGGGSANSNDGGSFFSWDVGLDCSMDCSRIYPNSLCASWILGR